jgi:hypothetical protein
MAEGSLKNDTASMQRDVPAVKVCEVFKEKVIT